MARLEDGLADVLPGDGTAGALGGRVWLPRVEGPAVVAIRDGGVFDISRAFPTMRDLCEAADPAAALPGGRGRADRRARRDPRQHAAGRPRPRQSRGCSRRSTCRRSRPPASPSSISMLERVIEERARGNPRCRRRPSAREISRLVGDDLAKLKPGSPEAARAEGGADRAGRVVASISRSASAPTPRSSPRRQPMAAVGTGMDAGLHPISTWNNPEPEVVLVVVLGRPDRRRDARQRRQPARRRGPLGAAARQGQGQQRLLRRSARSSACSTRASRSTTCASTEVTLDGRGRRTASGSRARPRCAKISRDPADLVAPDDRAAPPVSRRRRALPRHHVRAGRGPRRAGPGLHPQDRRHRHHRRAGARRASSTACATRPNASPGPSAPAP